MEIMPDKNKLNIT